MAQTVYDQLAPGMLARFNFYGTDKFYDGTVANLLGHSAPVNLAISPDGVANRAYQVTVSMPGLGTVPNCPIGKRGEVVFNRPSQ